MTKKLLLVLILSIVTVWVSLRIQSAIVITTIELNLQEIPQNKLPELKPYSYQISANNSLISNETLKNWTPVELKKQINQVCNILQNTKSENQISSFPFFHNNKKKPIFLQWKSIWSEKYKKITKLEIDEFFTLLNSPKSFSYFSSKFSQLIECNLNNSLSELEENLEFIKNFNQENNQANIWIGQQGCVSRLHYDASHNFYSQLYGRKLFILIPPIAQSSIYIYPFLHPNGRQSYFPFFDKIFDSFIGSSNSFEFPKKVNISESLMKDFPLANNLTNFPVYFVILHPGETLFMPAYWFHHVIALDLSISASVYLPNSEKDIVQTIFDSDLSIFK